MRRIETAGLKIALLGGPDGRGGGDGPLVLLMHGFGASGDDLIPLAGELRLKSTVRFAFPEAPLALSFDGMPTLPGMPVPRAWWEIDMARLQVGLATRDYSALVEDYPSGLKEARAAAIEMLDSLERELGLDSRRIVLGGFSQGAILTCDVALHDTRPFAGLALLSGSLVGRSVWAPRFEGRRGIKVFQSHGDADPVLPHDLAELLQQMMGAAGWDAEFVSFPGGHTIGPEALIGLRRFLQRVL